MLQVGDDFMELFYGKAIKTQTTQQTRKVTQLLWHARLFNTTHNSTLNKLRLSIAC